MAPPRRRHHNSTSVPRGLSLGLTAEGEPTHVDLPSMVPRPEVVHHTRFIQIGQRGDILRGIKIGRVDPLELGRREFGRLLCVWLGSGVGNQSGRQK